MSQIALTMAAAVGIVAIAAPAKAALFSWDVEYTGWWNTEGGGSVLGSFTADDADAADGIISGDEMTSWVWSWSGNDLAPAFDISSADPAADIQFSEGFYVDGTPNLPAFLDSLDQGTFVGGVEGEQVIDFEFLTVQADDPFPNGDPEVSAGDALAATGTTTVGAPTQVPEPATALGLLALVAWGGATLKRQNQAA